MIYVVAGTYAQFVEWRKQNATILREDVRYVGGVESIVGAARGFRVALVGSYYARKDWSVIGEQLSLREAVELVTDELTLDDHTRMAFGEEDT